MDSFLDSSVIINSIEYLYVKEQLKEKCFYYIKDVIVHPDWQKKHVGAALMKALTRWLENNAASNALVALITGETLAPFYQQFGFVPAFTMVKFIERDRHK